MNNVAKRSKFRNVPARLAGGATAFLVAGAASAQTGGIDTAEITAMITDVQTKGIAIASAVTLMVFLIAGAKWLRRAK